MAAKKKKGFLAGDGFVPRALRFSGVLGLGLVAGYCWRSYYPLALPFESKLVADRTSGELDESQWREKLESEKDKARRAEEERAQLALKVKDLESSRTATERELADMKIKSVLGP